jgi:hypothetical protein
MSLPKFTIQVRVQGGVVKNVDGIPSDYSVQVLDYDAQKYAPSQLSEDDNHRPCRILEWRADGQ